MKIMNLPTDNLIGLLVKTTDDVVGYWGHSSKNTVMLWNTPHFDGKAKLHDLKNFEEWEVLMSNYNLFVDDFYEPINVYRSMADAIGKKKSLPYQVPGWKIAHDMAEMQQIIMDNGLPAIISFDHDLTIEHDATVKADLSLYDQFNDTGYDCAVWIHELCKAEGLPFPTAYVHAAGLTAQRVRKYLDQISAAPVMEMYRKLKKYG